MNVPPKSAPSEESKLILESLRKAVAKDLEKKRRLGQYAVIWRDGRPVFIGEDAPVNTSIEVVKIEEGGLLDKRE
jgi:hypothetical protein